LGNLFLMNTQTTAILGAGIIGVSSAYLLSRAGHRVILIDAGEGPALGTSFANGGQLSYSYTDAMASPSLMAKMPHILMGRDPAFDVRLSLKAEFIRWGGQFMLNARRNKELENSRNIMRLSLHSKEVLHGLLAQSDIQFSHRASGKLHIYSSPEELQASGIRVKAKRQWGCPQQLLDASDCIDLEPSLSLLRDSIAGGVYSPIDEVGDGPAFARALLQQMVKQKNLDQYFNCRVHRLIKNDNRIDGIETSQGLIEADNYVLATGPDSLELSREIGLNLPICPIKGYSITVPATEQAPNICITDVSNKVVIARIGEHLRIAGCADIVGYDATLEESRIQHLLDVCSRTFVVICPN